MSSNKIYLFIALSYGYFAQSQTLSLQQAIKQVTAQYNTIEAKKAALAASEEQTKHSKTLHFPDLTFGAQQSYGTINAQHGTLYAYGGLGAASTSMPAPEQSWNAAFGALYFANINWNLFSFGKTKQLVKVAKAKQEISQFDLEQTIFQQQIKTMAVYLNLLAAQRIKNSQERNYERAQVFYDITSIRAENGLIPQVDERSAKAEMAYAKTQLIHADTKVLEWNKALAVLLEVNIQDFTLDTVFSQHVPVIEGYLEQGIVSHPALVHQEKKVIHSKAIEHQIYKASLPSINAFGVLQGRGSGFDWNYLQDPTAKSSRYREGVGIDRTNYLVGISLQWNISNFFRASHLKKQQNNETTRLTFIYEEMEQELMQQRQLTLAQYHNTVAAWQQNKMQLEAATMAFHQQKSLYENGLSTIVDFTQALYALQRAEIDFELAQNNIWQVVVLQSAALGDIDYVINAIPKN